jgi:phosphoglycolate phosphatase
MAIVHCNGVSFSPVEAIVFDKDGTLSDSQDFLRHLSEKRAACLDTKIPGLNDPVLRTFGVENDRINPSGLMAVGTREENEIAIAALVAQKGWNWIEARLLVREAFLQADQLLPRKADFTPPFPGVMALLKACHRVKVGILSSDSEANVRDFVDRYDLKPYVQYAMGVRAGLTKPNPQLLMLMCHELRVSPAKTLVVGDAIADIQLAHQGGAIGCIGVTWGGVAPEQLVTADTIADQISDIQLSDS